MLGNGKEGIDGVVGGQRELHKTAYDRGMLDLRLQLIKMRTECVTKYSSSDLLQSFAIAPHAFAPPSLVGSHGTLVYWYLVLFRASQLSESNQYPVHAACLLRNSHAELRRAHRDGGRDWHSLLAAERFVCVCDHYVPRVLPLGHLYGDEPHQPLNPLNALWRDDA